MPKDFSRDLGYLDKFLQGLREHAATLGEPSASRLGALLDDQDRAWSEIRGILSGAPSATSVATSASAGSPETPAVGAMTQELPYKRLTVGSLMS